MALYSISNSNPILEESFFLFLDVLGFSDEIIYHHTKGTSQINLNNFYNAFKAASSTLTQGPLAWDYKIFTDNIVLGTPINKRGDDEDDFGLIIIPLIYYQLSMVLDDFFIRGCWSKGSLYMDELIVYGYPLIEAYKLESKKAVNPRIIFSDDMKTVIQRHLSYYASHYPAPQKFHLLKDIDDEYFVNYLYAIMDDDDNPDYSALQKHKDVIEARLTRHKGDPKIFAKYVWCAEYHNYFCQTYISNCPNKYFITVINTKRGFSII